MKKNVHIVGCLCAALIMVSFAQPSTRSTPIDDVISAVKTGNAGSLARYFDQTVEISLPDRSDAYSKAQAELVMKDFFQSKYVKSFDVDHRSENGRSVFCIGTLVTRNGSFRTTLHMKTRSDKQALQEIRIEDKR